MTLSPEQDAFVRAGRFALLATTGASGGPQVTMVSYHWDGTDAVVSLRSSAIKWTNVVSPPRMCLTVVDGQKYLSLYGRADTISADPEREVLTRRLQQSLSVEHGAMLQAEFDRGLDAAGRVVIVLRPERAAGRV